MTTDQLINGLLSVGQLQGLSEPEPSIYTVQGSRLRVSVCGCPHAHTRVPETPHLKLIESVWREFIASTAAQARHVTIQGHPSPKDTRYIVEQGDRDTAIRLLGETGLVVLLAERDAVNILARDATTRPFVRSLLESLTTGRVSFNDQVFYYYAARELDRWLRGAPGHLSYDHMQRIVDESNAPKDLRLSTGYPYTFAHLDRIHKKIFGRPLRDELADFFARVIMPRDDASPINRVAARALELRCQLMARQLAGSLKAGFNVFVVCGVRRALMLQPALQHALDDAQLTWHTAEPRPLSAEELRAIRHGLVPDPPSAPPPSDSTPEMSGSSLTDSAQPGLVAMAAH